ncbi:hypothetical protein TCE0_017r03476 [Talaromyces pinophilus]|uniref:Uncharacterized protein n=1 Tax=Talaromyces pinophilus TaxID=128442 RepID=A0A6V8H355_TALPI|nr:hypothetical protein TCE0_017r03476 [Talaromyces pinophilus]
MPRQATITPEDVDIRWPFRAGYPRLPRPPVWTSVILDEAEKPISDANFEQLRSRIDAILETYDIPCARRSHELAYRRSPTSMLLRVTVDCMYDKEASHSAMWKRAVTEIYAATQSMVEGDTEVGVELFDSDYMHSSHICAPPPAESQELSLNWERGYSYCEQILQLFESPSQMIQAMLPTGRCSAGKREYEWITVIYFSALNADDRAWDYIEQRIRSILPSHIGIEIRQRTRPLFCNDDGDSDSTQGSTIGDRCMRPPRPGCEISRQGDKESGTMGGYIVTEAHDTKGKTIYGVTNAHVALSGYEERTFKDPAGSEIVMQSPAEDFRETNKFKLCKIIPPLEKTVREHKVMIEALKAEHPIKDPTLVERLERNLRKNEKDLAPLKSDLHFIEQDPRIGSVHHARLGARNVGSTTSPNRAIVDIALVKMSCLAGKSPEEIFLKTNSVDPWIGRRKTCNFWEVDSLGEHNNPEKHINVVAKVSKSGTYSTGIVSAFKAHIFDGLRKNGVKTGEKLYAWTILSRRGYTKPRGPLDMLYNPDESVNTFTSLGDSGSYIMAAADWECGGHDNRVAMPSEKVKLLGGVDGREPFVVGLLFGAHTTDDVTYFMSMDMVKSEIESMTGEKMVWPQNRTEYLEKLEQGHF